MTDYLSVKSYDPYYEEYCVLFMKGMSLGYKRGVWVYGPRTSPMFVSETLGL